MIRNLLLTFIVFSLSVSILWMTLNRLDPLGVNKVLAYFALFVSLFLSVSLFGTFIFFFGNEFKNQRKLGTRHYLMSLRRGVLLGLFVIGVVALQVFGIASVVECVRDFTPETGCNEMMLTWDGAMEVVLWGIFLVMVELVFLSAKKR